MRHSRQYDFQGHPRSGSRSADDLSPLSGLFLFFYYAAAASWPYYLILSFLPDINAVHIGHVYSVWLIGATPYEQCIHYQYCLRYEGQHTLVTTWI